MVTQGPLAEARRAQTPELREIFHRIRGRNPKIPVKPNKSAQKFARWGLEARRKAKKSRRGGLTTREAGRQGIGSGVARARDIIAGRAVDASQVLGFCSRHEKNYRAALARARKSKRSLREAAQDEPALQAYWLWGGEPMCKLAKRAVEKAKR